MISLQKMLALPYAIHYYLFMIYLKFVRLNNGLRQDDLAIQTGIPQYRISRLERGESRPTPDERAWIAQVLGVSEDTIFRRVKVAG
jgi:transcriptional regulator with XRE-family HTH domain